MHWHGVGGKYKMRRCIVLLSTVCIIAGLAVAQACASSITMTFEGVGNYNPVGEFYNGGAGGSLGVSFSSNALGLVDIDAGGSGRFGGEPSPSTVLFFLKGSAATMNVPGGFLNGLSFYYTTPFYTGQVKVYDAPDAAGNLLATLDLPLTPYNGAPDPNGVYSPLLKLGVSFTGSARSVDFGGTADKIGFDDITIGDRYPVDVVPEPPTILGVGIPVLMVGLGRLRRPRS